MASVTSVTVDDCEVRPAKSLEEARDLCWPLISGLGWNRAEADMQTHYTVATHWLGPGGWLHAVNKNNPDKPEGCIVPLAFDNGTGWIAFFCMHEALRGKGWGGKMFAACLERLKFGNAEIVGLDAVEEQVKTYERRGFVDKGLVRLMGRKGTRKLPLEGDFEHVASQVERMVPLKDVPGEILTQSDLKMTGLKRSKLWTKEALFHREDAWGLALVKEGKEEDLEGWILIRACENGWRFGPLYAETKDIAKLLLHQAMRRLQSEEGSYAAEVWFNNPDAVALFEECGWEALGVDYHRMWLNGVVPEAQQKGGIADEQMFATFDAAEG